MTKQGDTMAARSSGAAILIIEDSPTQAEQLRYMLEKSGYRTSVSGNGREALTLFPEMKPSLVISDIIMPEMDGYELCRQIKETCGDPKTPVMLLTSLADPHDVIRGLECGADAFITKPYEEEYLLSRIDYMLTNRSPCSQGTSDDGLAIEFGGQEYCITADRRQILDLLLSTYETAMQKNTELIKTRDEMSRLNEQLETANRDLEAFNYTVSHDLRGPLTNISGYSQALRDIYAESLDEQAKDFIKEIYQATLRMDKMIGSLLSFSKMNHRVLKLESVDLSVLALSVATDLRYRDMQRTVNFTIAEEVVANGDAVLLRVVMENLIGNAWKYTGKRERAEISFGVTETCGERTYFVRDNGVGFDMDQADRLFDAFERLHSREEFEGSGIGLATVKRIIQRHGGTIWAEGEVDHGATFYFTLCSPLHQY